MSGSKENNTIRTAQRANGTILSLTNTPQSPDFYTDSLLDASKIPTPSPKKQAFSAAYKGRRALGNTRTLKDVWNATALPRPSAPADRDPNRLSPPFRVSPAPLQTRTTWAREDRKQSPPPMEPYSPLSDVSSPPRGLTDVYQRIADEEDLAAQEGEIEEEEYMDGSMHEEIDSTGDELLYHHRPHSVLFPRALHSEQAEDHEVGADKENQPNDELRSVSDPSGMSFLQGLTDQSLAAKLTPHTLDRASDRARIERAVHNEKPIAFRHGYRSKSGLTIQKLLQNDIDAVGASRRSASSTSSTTNQSEPPPNLPRVWGTKSKAGKEWLRARREHLREGPRSSPGPDLAQTDWAAAAAEVALQSTEDSSTPRASPEDLRSASIQRQSSLERIKQWELNDFTGQSFQVSQSPPVRVRQDQVRDREIENLEKRAVTTSRLGEIRQRDSKEQLRRSASSSAGTADATNIEIAPSTEKMTNKIDAVGEQIPGTPIVVYRSSSAGSRSDEANGEVRAAAQANATKTLENLRRLARSTSNSPRTSQSPEDWSLIGSEEQRSAELSLRIGKRRHDGAEASAPENASRKSSKEVADVAATPKVTGAWTDTVLPDTVFTLKKQGGNAAKYTQTPHINAGGWVDTPIAARRHASAMAPIPLEEAPEELMDGMVMGLPVEAAEEAEAPALSTDAPPRQSQQTALGSLLDRAKRRLVSQDTTSAKESNDTLNLGEATLESLEDLLSLDANDMTTLARLSTEIGVSHALIADNQGPGNVAEAQVLERLSSKLERLRTNIHDARKGISKLEHQVNTSPQGTLSNAQSLTKGVPTPHFPISYSLLYLAIPVPHLFYTRRADLGHWFPRPTMLGWAILTIWLWYLTECTMAELFSHPFYAEHYDWPVEREPLFPWVLPTMLSRWLRFDGIGTALLGFVWILFQGLFRALGQIFGLTDGFTKDPLPAELGAAMHPSQERRGIDLTMTSDEYV